jgi:hypothetical protein
MSRWTSCSNWVPALGSPPAPEEDAFYIWLHGLANLCLLTRCVLSVRKEIFFYVLKKEEILIQHKRLKYVEALHVCIFSVNKTHNENPIYVFPEKALRSLSPNFNIHVFVSDLYIPRIGSHIFLQQRR